jgi:hypothetical protein
LQRRIMLHANFSQSNVVTHMDVNNIKILLKSKAFLDAFEKDRVSVNLTDKEASSIGSSFGIVSHVSGLLFRRFPTKVLTV